MFILRNATQQQKRTVLLIHIRIWMYLKILRLSRRSQTPQKVYTIWSIYIKLEKMQTNQMWQKADEWLPEDDNMRGVEKKILERTWEWQIYVHYPDYGGNFMRVCIPMSKFINLYTLTCNLLYANYTSLNCFKWWYYDWTGRKISSG